MHNSETAHAWEGEALRQSVLAEVSKRTLSYGLATSSVANFASEME